MMLIGASRTENRSAIELAETSSTSSQVLLFPLQFQHGQIDSEREKIHIDWNYARRSVENLAFVC